MASFVNAADIIASAVEIERRGHKFYQQAEQSAADKEAREFFAFMAGEELKHEKIFASMLISQIVQCSIILYIFLRCDWARFSMYSAKPRAHKD